MIIKKQYKIEKQYKGLYYSIENHENGSNFEVYEYTPVLKEKHSCCFGSSVEQEHYTCEYVESLIDEELKNI